MEPLAKELFERMVSQGESFWSVVHKPFMARDLTRAEVRYIIRAGLERTRGNYTVLVRLFNMMGPTDYKHFLNFLTKHECHVPYREFRTDTAPHIPGSFSLRLM